ncbi:MAG: OsmC family protein [Gaiellaceae bacterium]
MDLRAVQRPLKDGYKADPASARLTLSARGVQDDAPISCSVDLGRAIYAAQAHAGVGGAGTGACSGDLLLGALSACAQITCQMVAAAMDIPTQKIEAVVEGDLDLRGTLGTPEVPVGFQAIRLRLEVVAPEASAEQLAALAEKTERYCVVAQTLLQPPEVEFALVAADGR